MKKNEGVTYRPPYEYRSFLLQVTRGCSHGKCSFCTMYKDIPFRMEPMDEIKADIIEAGAFYPRIRRVFLENGDPFYLSADNLCEIAECIHENLPEVSTISMYASVKNIIPKSDAELRRLAGLGINELNIGVESGLDDVLRFLNKGFTADQAVYELTRLTGAGIDYTANVIFGAAGAGRGIENAEATARLLNAAPPVLIFTGTIHSSPGCPLYEQMQDGSFKHQTVGEYLDEEERLLSLLSIDECRYYSTHPSNLTGLRGRLPRDKDRLLSEIAEARQEFSAVLDHIPVSHGEEGFISVY